MMSSRIPAIEAKLIELKKLEAERETYDALIETLKDEIKAEMGDEEVLDTGIFKVTYKPVTTNRFDSKSFKGDHPDLYAAYTKPSVSRPFKVA